MMDFLEVTFLVSGVRTNVLVPPLTALVISFFTSMGGVSGAFLILPFQMSVLGYTSPSVSATNFVYNIVGIPSGVYRYMKEGRMNWPLVWTIVAGTMPGLFIGYYIRVFYLPEPGRFKVFVGLVLLYVSAKMLYDVVAKGQRKGKAGAAASSCMKTLEATLRRVSYEFRGETYAFGTAPVFALAFVVGIVGGVYGIGGGAIIAPFLVAVFDLPIYTVAGAALMGTLLSSVAGVTFYSLVPSGFNTLPDWPLGVLFGLGGLFGMYFGARAQKHMPQRFIKSTLALAIFALALKYVLGL